MCNIFQILMQFLSIFQSSVGASTESERTLLIYAIVYQNNIFFYIYKNIYIRLLTNLIKIEKMLYLIKFKKRLYLQLS